MRPALLPLLALAACGQLGIDLPSSRLTSSHFVTSGDGLHMGVGGPVTEDHGVYVDPRCRAREAELRARPTPILEVPRTSPLLHADSGAADGRYVRFGTLRVIYLRAGLYGWYRADVALHELCHDWLDETTGSPVFHR